MRGCASLEIDDEQDTHDRDESGDEEVVPDPNRIRDEAAEYRTNNARNGGDALEEREVSQPLVLGTDLGDVDPTG